MRHWHFFALFLIAATVCLGQDEAPQEAPAPPSAAEATTDDLAAGTDIIVWIRGGQRLRAVFVKWERDALVMKVGPVETRLPRDQVERVVAQRPAIERYREMRAVIDDADIERLLALIEWSRVNRLYDEAMRDLEHVASMEPTNPEGIRLRRLIENERRLREREGAAGGRDTSTPTEDVTRIEGLRSGQFPLLSEEQVNLLKVWELDLNNPPRLLVDRSTVDKLLDRYGDDPGIPTTRDGREAFHRKPPVEIVAEMFRLRARELYGEVRVLGMPLSLDLFRNHINGTWLVNNCATTRCHGGLDAGRFMLYNRQQRGEQAALTNYLILERSTLSDGRPLLDYQNPDRSPLLHLGLSRPESAFPHPDVKGWRPVFRSTDSRGFRQAVEWLRSMHEPRAEAPIEYVPPTPADFDESRVRSEPQPR